MCAAEHGGVRPRACGGMAELEEMLFLSRRSKHRGDETWMNNCSTSSFIKCPRRRESAEAGQKKDSFLCAGVGWVWAGGAWATSGKTR